MRNPFTVIGAWLDQTAHIRRLEMENTELAHELAVAAAKVGDWKRTAEQFKEMAARASIEAVLAKEQLSARDVMLDESERRAAAFESLARRRGVRTELVA